MIVLIKTFQHEKCWDRTKLLALSCFIFIRLFLGYQMQMYFFSSIGLFWLLLQTGDFLTIWKMVMKNNDENSPSPRRGQKRRGGLVGTVMNIAFSWALNAITEAQFSATDFIYAFIVWNCSNQYPSHQQNLRIHATLRCGVGFILSLGKPRLHHP